MIPEGFISSLLERADIVDVIGRYDPQEERTQFHGVLSVSQRKDAVLFRQSLQADL